MINEQLNPTKMKRFEYYSRPKVTYPKKTDYITLYVYDRGVLLWSGPHYEKSKGDLKQEYPKAVIQEVFDENPYKEHRRKYDEELNRLHEEFKSDLYAEFGVSDNPKRGRLFNIAWDHAHSDGYSQVYEYFADLVDLIKD
jgi:hypothetical protein